MHLAIDTSNGLPIYEQIVRHVKFAVANQMLQIGEHVPSVRDMATRLAVNPNTVARAYRELEAAGVVEKRRTAGTYVSEQGSPLARRERMKILTERVDALLAEARQMDVAFEDLLKLAERRHAAMQPAAEV